jgi:hypothetical protein
MTVATDPRKTGVNAGMTLLAASAVAIPLTGTTNETTLATVAVPAGAMGLNGAVEIRTTWSNTNSANNKTPRVRFGGASGTVYFAVILTTTVAYLDIPRRIRNRNSASSQVGVTSSGGTFGTSGGAPTTSTVDTSATVDVVITGQLANSGENLTLESYEVWLLP